jgi:DNA polymerase-3 subunit epsilon
MLHSILGAPNLGLLHRLTRLIRPAPSDPRLRRNHEFFRSFDQNQPLQEYDFTVIDTELTGLIPGQDEIVSIGAVRIKNLQIHPQDSFYSLVRPRMDLPKLSTLIHHITPQTVEQAPTLDEVLPRFLDYLGSSLIVAHHVGLDMSFLNRSFTKQFGAPLHTPCLDTLRLAQAFQEELFGGYYDQYNYQISYQLGDLAQKHGLPAFSQHNAFSDAMQAAYLFLFLVKKLRNGSIRSLKELHQVNRLRLINF